jgi:hypothetical protein
MLNLVLSGKFQSLLVSEPARAPKGDLLGANTCSLCRCHLKKVANQVAKASALLISPLLKALVQLPVGSKGDPLGAPAQQIGRARGSRG